MITSTDREEIRWKFQVMLDNVDLVIKEIEIEKNLIDDRYLRSVNEIEKMRNYWFAGIGFVVTTLIAIILAKNLDTIYYIYPSVGVIAIFIIFFITNLKLASTFLLFREIDDSYYFVLKGTLIRLKGMISTFALIDEFTKENTMILITYVSIYGKSLSYHLSQYLEDKLKLGQFKHEYFRKDYDLAKSSVDKLKEMNYPLGMDAIEGFIKNFEKIDKRKKPKT